MYCLLCGKMGLSHTASCFFAKWSDNLIKTDSDFMLLSVFLFPLQRQKAASFQITRVCDDKAMEGGGFL